MFCGWIVARIYRRLEDALCTLQYEIMKQDSCSLFYNSIILHILTTNLSYVVVGLTEVNPDNSVIPQCGTRSTTLLTTEAQVELRRVPDLRIEAAFDNPSRLLGQS